MGVLIWVCVSSAQMPIFWDLLATCLLSVKLPAEMHDSGRRWWKYCARESENCQMARHFGHIYLISLPKQNLKGEWSGSKGAACMCVSWSTNGLQINGTDTALEPPQYFWIYSKATPFLPAHLELPTIYSSLIPQMTPPTHAPQSHISSPTVTLLPPKPCPQPWS